MLLDTLVNMVSSELVVGIINVNIVRKFALEEGGGTTLSFPNTLMLGSVFAEKSIHLDIVTSYLKGILGDTLVNSFLNSIFFFPDSDLVVKKRWGIWLLTFCQLDVVGSPQPEVVANNVPRVNTDHDVRVHRTIKIRSSYTGENVRDEAWVV